METAMPTREEGEAALARILLGRIRHDKHPSVAEMAVLEEMLPGALLPEYINILLEKVLTDRWPSITMLRRIQRLTQQLPRD
jgi:hypothetical protein